MTKQEKLEALRNRPTRYEAQAVHPDGRRVILPGYTPRRSQTGLFNLVSGRAEENLITLALPRDARMFPGKGQTIKVGDWTVSFTGRTQRECIMAEFA